MLRLLGVVALVLAVAFPASAQPQCGLRDQLVRALATEYGEAPSASGMVGNGNLVEVLTSPSGTWSILVTRPGGVSCIVASGDGWVETPPAAPGRDS